MTRMIKYIGAFLASVVFSAAISSCVSSSETSYDNNVTLEPSYVSTADLPRVVVMTSGETDDQSSMVHFLLYTNEMHVEAIIQTNSIFNREGAMDGRWIENHIDAYEKVYPNLKVHDNAYPSPDYLRSISFIGDVDPSHLPKTVYAEKAIPGREPEIDPNGWADTPGSDKIANILLEEDPRPVFIQAWGGMNTALVAFEKIKREYPSEYKRAVSKAVIYCTWYQDGAGNYIERYHPDVTILLNHHFNGSWDYGSMTNSSNFVSQYLMNGKNPLGELYKQVYISEGDSPSFLYTANNGLRSYENPSYGGWGGRFYKVNGFENVYRDTGYSDLREWFEPAMHDFQARLSWCVTPKYEDANHKPIISAPDGLEKHVHSGDTVYLSVHVVDYDTPDIDNIWALRKESLGFYGITYQMLKKMAENPSAIAPYVKSDIYWSQHMAGTYQSNVDLQYTSDSGLLFIAPEVSRTETIHIIAEAVDKGFPRLTSYARFIVTVDPRK